MASKLCCTAEQEGRPGSPQLPNARIGQTTPANQPLLPKRSSSPNSHFTSARSGDLHELRQIFENAEDHASGRASPTKALRPRSSRRSVYSLHSLHRMKSMRSILQRKFSRDMPKAKSKNAGREADSREPDTVIKHANADPKRELNITKEDLRKDLLSDKKPAEGGYDSDAEVLNDVARNIGKKTPSKRPSIHSIDWSPSTASKSTPGSSTQRRNSAELTRHVQPYQIQQPQPLSLSSRVAHVFSTSNLRTDGPSERDRQLRRSHSATSMGLPKPSPLSPLRLPSLTICDQNGTPWSEAISESLRLSQFPVPPRHEGLKPSKTPLAEGSVTMHNHPGGNTEHVRVDEHSLNVGGDTGLSLPTRGIEIRVQQPTSIASPRPSTSVRGGFQENAPPAKDVTFDSSKEGEEDDNPRRSVHLYSMRISHHLRSGSLLSWDQLAADAPELPTPPRGFRDRTVSDQSRNSHMPTQVARNERQTSSSGIASHKIPSRWGNVVPGDRDARADVASSIYSSRPQSPPDSFGGSMVNLSRTASGERNFSQSSVNLRKPRRSISFPTDNEETPRPAPRYGVSNLVAAQEISASTSLLAAPLPLARKNSVADTKTSKFREGFSPSPPKKKIAPSTSIMKFLNPKRLSLRSLSEANLESDAPNLGFDGPHDILSVPADRERRQSRSMISLQAEQDALGKNKGANHVWDQALKAHQEEKASMFFPKNKELAVHASPFRERSGSVTGHRPSFQEDIDPVAEAYSISKRFSVPMLVPKGPDDEHEPLSTLSARRTATSGKDDVSLRQEVAHAFDRQGDSAEVVGAWGRYPSHTRLERTLSAGKADRVKARDFALEAAIQFASARDIDHDEDLVDPTERRPSPPLLPGEKKRKKRVGSGKMAKSHSMTFGRKLIKNYYSGMFKSSSSEFRQHGRGHRSSIASGGTLKHPELEMLPEVFMSGATDGAGGSRSTHSDKQVVRRHSERHSDTNSNTKSKLPIGDSMATLRPRRNSSAPNLRDLVDLHDGTDDTEQGTDRARVWSVYYETCVPSFPRLSTDVDSALEDFGGPSRISFDSKRVSLHSHTLPARFPKHARNLSQLSRRSNTTQASAHLSMEPDDAASEEKSLVSVRRSTMDLISKFKEQEHTEHEHVLSLTRAESTRGMEAL